MAKSKSFFGKRRGSTKNFTFTVFNGHQVTKEKAEQVKNPRTLAQMRNRMVLTTSSAAYAAMREIVDHSFQGYTYGLQNMSRFQSVNNKLLRADIDSANPTFAYCNYGEAKPLVGSYQVSEGSLTPIYNHSDLAKNGTISMRWEVASTLNGENLTAQNICEALGLNVGGLATMVAIVKSAQGVSGVTNYIFVYVRLTVLKTGTDVLTTSNYSEFFKIESNIDCTVSISNLAGLVIDLDSNVVASSDDFCYGVIKSELVNGSWARSTTRMTTHSAGTLNPTPEVALATYPVGASYILNDGDIIGGHEVEPAP